MSECIQADCFDVMAEMPSGSVDMILTDPPYGTINQKWDVEINVPKMFKEFLRIAKEKAAIVIMCQQPFATDLMNAGRNFFREELIWDKKRVLGFFNANSKHLRVHENILVFSKERNQYNPVMTQKDKPEWVGGGSSSAQYTPTVKIERLTTEAFPKSIIEISNAVSLNNAGHPTEKPEKLFEYLVKTYSSEGDVIFDPFAGSFTTAMAALATKRNFICIEKEEEYFNMGNDRIKAWHESKPYSRNMDKSQIGVFE